MRWIQERFSSAFAQFKSRRNTGLRKARSLAWAASLLCLSVSFAGGKHPRAIQLEKQIAGNIESQLKTLLGAEPFIVQVQVEPLTVNRETEIKTQLPFLGQVDEEVVDLWNDPDVPDYMLLNRVNRITANISVHQDVPDQWLEDIKSLARKQWPFFEGRDFVNIEKKNLKIAKPEDSKGSVYEGIHKAVWGVLGALLFYAIIHWLGTWLASKRLAGAISQVKIDMPSVNPASSAWSGSGRETQRSSDESYGLRGDTRISGGELQLHDTIKISELILSWVTELERVKNFPTLEDMKIFEEELVRYPGSVGALVNAFPDSLKNSVFAYSRSEAWYEALLNPSLLDAKSFALMNRLMRVNRHLRPELEERLLLHAWYAEDKLVDFLNGLEADDSVWILSHLPKSTALALGREVLPGRWAILLDHEKLGKLSRKPSETKLQNYLNTLSRLKPLRTPELLSLFKQERDLISYLNTTHPQVEKEIYLAAGDSSAIHVLRPPFYPLFELEDEPLKTLVSQLPMELLSKSLFNLSKDYRVKIEKALSDKQKFLLLDFLKRWDKKGLSPDLVGEARSEVGRKLKQFLSEWVPPASTGGEGREPSHLRAA
jgi:hypothetical protein